MALHWRWFSLAYLLLLLQKPEEEIMIKTKGAEKVKSAITKLPISFTIFYISMSDSLACTLSGHFTFPYYIQLDSWVSSLILIYGREFTTRFVG